MYHKIGVEDPKVQQENSACFFFLSKIVFFYVSHTTRPHGTPYKYAGTFALWVKGRPVSLYPYNRSQICQYVKHTK